MFATGTPGSGSKIGAPGGRSRGHDGRELFEVLVRVDNLFGPRWPVGRDASRVPPTTVTPHPFGRWLYRPGVTGRLAFFVGRGVGTRTTLWMEESLASSAGFGCRTTLVQIQPSRLQTEGQA